jgi:hypothetical protein
MRSPSRRQAIAQRSPSDPRMYQETPAVAALADAQISLTHGSRVLSVADVEQEWLDEVVWCCASGLLF